MQKLLTFFFSKNISVFAISNDQSCSDTLTNDIVSFEQFGPGSQRGKTYLVTCAPKESSDQPEYTHSVVSLRCTHDEPFHFWLPKCDP